MPDVAPLGLGALGSRAQQKLPELPEAKNSRWQYCAKQRKIREAPKIAARKKLLQSFSARLSGPTPVVHSRSAGNLSPIRESSITEVPWWQSHSNAGFTDSPLSREQTSGRIPWAASRSRACSACALGWSTWRNDHLRRGTELEIFRGQTHEGVRAGVMKLIDHLDDLDVDELNVSGRGPPTLEETMSKVKADDEGSSVPEVCALALSTRHRRSPGPSSTSRSLNNVASLKARVSSRHSSIEPSGLNGSLPLEPLRPLHDVHDTHDATMSSSPSLSRVLTSTSASYMAPSKLSPREPKSPEDGVLKRRATSTEVDALQEPEEDEHAVAFDFRTVILAASVRKVQRIWRSKIKRSLSNVFKELPEDDDNEPEAKPTGQRIEGGEGDEDSDLTAEQQTVQGHESTARPESPEPRSLGPPEARWSVSTIGGNDLRDTLPCNLEMGWRREESPATEGRFEDGDDNGDEIDAGEQLEVTVDLQQSPQHDQETQAQQSPSSESGRKLAETAEEDPLSDRSQSVPSPSHLIRAVCTDKPDKPNVNSSNVSESGRSEGAVSGDDRHSPVEQKNDVAEVEDVEESLGIPGRDRSSASMASDSMQPGSHSRDANVSGDYSEEFEEGNDDSKLTFSVAVVDVDKNGDENVANHGPDSPTSPASPAALSEAPSRDCQHLSASEAVPSMTSASMEQSQSGEDPFLENLAGNRHIHTDPFLEHLAGNQPIPHREPHSEDVKDELGDGEFSGQWSEDSQSLEARELQENECSGDWSSQGEISEPDLC